VEVVVVAVVVVAAVAAAVAVASASLTRQARDKPRTEFFRATLALPREPAWQRLE
jgi:hypothetical protein